ncbi:hypothetical protein LCGC14_1745730 [marine sediment metagenome]|uniref:FHA domain-containing protein n=1 Tax=marine sediment metagenome TaxID=412755 RepID=A0A0F9K4X2_9ZZZZ
MPQIWAEQDNGKSPWAVLPLDGEAEVFYLTGEASRPVTVERGEGARSPAAYIIRHAGSKGTQRWMLFSNPDGRVSVNGRRVLLGVRALRDKDELRVGQCRMFFSTHGLAVVESCTDLGKSARCVRCDRPLVKGQPVVRCPAPKCGAWHHQFAGWECWTYGPKCTCCEQSTELDGSYTWTPEEL